MLLIHQPVLIIDEITSLWNTCFLQWEVWDLEDFLDSFTDILNALLNAFNVFISAVNLLLVCFLHSYYNIYNISLEGWGCSQPNPIMKSDLHIAFNNALLPLYILVRDHLSSLAMPLRYKANYFIMVFNFSYLHENFVTVGNLSVYEISKSV